MFPAEATPPHVSIVTLNWNGFADTARCLESLQKLTYASCAVVVVDNGSGNDQAERLRCEFPFIAELIANTENRGFTGGCNQGIEWALAHGSAFVLLLNNDTIVAPNLLEALLDVAAARPNAAAIAAKEFELDRPDEAKTPFAYIRRWPFYEDRLTPAQIASKVPVEVDTAEGPAVLLSLTAIRAIGLLDHRFFAYKELTDWCLRASKAGFVSLWAPTAHIWHRRSRPRSAAADSRTITNLFLLVRKHGTLAQQAFFLVWFFAWQTERAIKLLLAEPRRFISRLQLIGGAVWRGLRIMARGS